MINKFNNQNNSNIYSWNDAFILDKLEEILKSQNLDELELTDELLNNLLNQLSENTSYEEINNSAHIIAQNIDTLRPTPSENAKDYILRLKKYLDTTTFKHIKAEFKGVEFEISKDSYIEDIFDNFYAKYDEMYGITSMLFDLGLK